MRAPVLLLACLPAVASVDAPLYDAVPGAGLPPGLTAGLSMDAKAADLDGDGDLDLVVAMEWAPHLMLFNDGKGRFSEDPGRSPRTTYDHEEAVLADLDGDGAIDILLVSEDDRAKELYLNDGKGRFIEASDRLPLALREAAVLALEGFEPREVGEVLGIAANTAAQRMKRAREALRATLEDGA